MPARLHRQLVGIGEGREPDEPRSLCIEQLIDRLRGDLRFVAGPTLAPEHAPHPVGPQTTETAELTSSAPITALI